MSPRYFSWEMGKQMGELLSTHYGRAVIYERLPIPRHMRTKIPVLWSNDTRLRNRRQFSVKHAVLDVAQMATYINNIV